MRVAVWHNLPSGGGQRALYDHVRGLVSRGHNVEIWAPPTAENTPLDFRELAPYHEVGLGTGYRRGPEALRGRAGFVLLSDLKAMDQHCQHVGAEIGQVPFDVFLSGTCARFGAPRIGRWVNLPSVLYLQEPSRSFYEAPNIWALPASSPSLKGKARNVSNMLGISFRRLQVREEIGNAKAFGTILVNSRFSAESVARAYGLATEFVTSGLTSTSGMWANAAPRIWS